MLQVSLLSLVPQSHHLHRDDLPKQLGCGDLLAEDTVGIFQQQSYVATEEQERLNRFPEASLSSNMDQPVRMTSSVPCRKTCRDSGTATDDAEAGHLRDTRASGRS